MFLMSSPKLLLKILTGTEYIYTAFQGQQRALFSSPSLEKHESESCSVMSNSLQTHGLYSPWNSLGQNTGGGSFSLLQGNLPNPGIKPRSPRIAGVFFYQLSHKGSPRILEWVAYPFSRGSSRSRNRTGVSFIAGRLSTEGVNRHLCIEAGEKVKVYDSSEKCFIYLTIS